MYNKILGELSFDNGYEKYISVYFGQKESEVSLYLLAYSEKDGVTKEQEGAYTQFEQNKKEYVSKVENLLASEFGTTAEQRFTLQTIFISRSGELALLFDDKNNLDEGIAVQILPSLLLANQSDYL